MKWLIKIFFLITLSVPGMLLSEEKTKERTGEELEGQEEKVKKSKNPDLARKLALFPGAGQFYNEKYLKGFIFFASDFLFLSK